MGQTAARLYHRHLRQSSMEHPMSQLNDLSRSLTSLEQDNAIIAVIEMSSIELARRRHRSRHRAPSAEKA